MEERTDAELVARAHAGDRIAFDRLVGRYQEVAVRVARGMVKREEVARELAQEAMLQAYLSLAHLREPERFGSWLYGIVLNVCRSYLRDRKEEPLSLEALSGGIRCPEWACPAPDPQEAAEERELRNTLLDAVQALSPRDRAATLLFYYDDLSLREIAELLDASVVAIKGRLHNARQHLRERLLPVYPERARPSPSRQRRKRMIRARVAAVVEKKLELDGQPHWCVMLLDEAGQRALPIYVGRSEAHLIDIALRQTPTDRPLTFDFITQILEATGGTLEEVRVEALRENTYYAISKIRCGDTTRELDCRPSDALALAVRIGCPIFVQPQVLEEAGIEVPEALSYGVAVPQRFTGPAGAAFAFAREDAARRGEETHCGTEHVLLGLLSLPECRGTRALESMGLTLDAVRSQTEASMTPGPGNAGQPLTLTARARKVLYLASDEAVKAASERIDTGHLLVGLIREGDGLGGRVLIRLGATPERVHAALADLPAES